MRVREPFEMPPDIEKKVRRAQRLEWVSIAIMLSGVVVVGLVLGSSQAMKAAWVEDLLSLVPPAAFLIAARYRNTDPNARFPWGYHRAISVAFLVAAVALLVFGSYIFVDSVLKLVYAEHPTIGTIEVFGKQIWHGWLMIGALIYTAVPPVILGRMKLPLATELHEKVLHTDAEMNKADWMTGGAAILGVIGIGYGFWWADALAAGIISLDIVKDGVTNVKQATLLLMDEQATKVGTEEKDPLENRVKKELEGLDWVKKASVRLREEGELLTGDAFVVPASEAGLLDNLDEAHQRVLDIHWRIYNVNLVPVRSLDQD